MSLTYQGVGTLSQCAAHGSSVGAAAATIPSPLLAGKKCTLDDDMPPPAQPRVWGSNFLNLVNVFLPQSAFKIPGSSLFSTSLFNILFLLPVFGLESPASMEVALYASQPVGFLAKQGVSF